MGRFGMWFGWSWWFWWPKVIGQGEVVGVNAEKKIVFTVGSSTT